MNLKKFSVILVCMIMLITTLSGCKEAVILDDADVDNNVQNYPLEIGGVTISSQSKKVAVLSAEYADIVVALNYEEYVILVSDDCTQEEYNNTTKISSDDTASIIANGVEVVICETMSDAMMEELTTAGIAVVQLSTAYDRNTFQTLYSSIASVLGGASTGYAKGISVAESIYDSLDDLVKIIPSTATINTGAIVLSLDGSIATGTMMADALMSCAGVTNLYKGSPTDVIDFSDLASTQPEYIFVDENILDEFLALEEVQDLNAVLENKVYGISTEELTYLGRTTVQLAFRIAEYVYPELLEEDDNEPELPDDLIDDSEYADLLTVTPEPTTDPSELYDSISQGTTSDDVLAMQERLFELGYLTEEYDGYYGSVTVQAISDFQKSVGLEQTGEADSKTLVSLYSDTAPSATPTATAEPTTEPTDTDSTGIGTHEE